MDNLQLRQRIVRSMIRVSERTANMRKPEKFEYRKHMTAAFMDMLELCIEANRARGSRRVELQNKMDTKLDVLRSLVDTAVSPEDRLISPGLHEKWIEKNIIFKRKEMADIELPQEVTQWELHQF